MLRRNLQRNVLAGGFSLSVVTLQQLILLPVFLHFWPKEQYGIWLVLMSFPAYLQLADIGLVTATANRMSTALAVADTRAANDSLHTTTVALALLSLALLALGWGLGVWVDAGGFAALDPAYLPYAVLAMELLAVYAAAALFQGLVHAVMRATGHNYLSEVSYGLTMLAEMGVCIGGLVAGNGILELLMLVALARCITTGLSGAVALTLQNIIAPWKGRWSQEEFRVLFGSGVAFLAFPLGYALINQGSVLVVAAVFGPAMVVVFTAARTLANTVFAWPNLLSKAIGPEVARLHSIADQKRLQMVIKLALEASLAVLVPASLLVFFWRDWLLQVWTNGKVAVGAALLGLFLCRITFQTFWAVPSTALTYTNRHHGYSTRFVIAACGFILLLYLLTPLTDIWVVPVLLIAADIVLARYVLRRIRQDSDVELVELWIDLVSFMSLRNEMVGLLKKEKASRSP